MSHAFLLCFQVKDVMVRCLDLDGDPFRDLHAETGQLVDLIRIIGEQPQGLYPEIP